MSQKTIVPTVRLDGEETEWVRDALVHYVRVYLDEMGNTDEELEEYALDMESLHNAALHLGEELMDGYPLTSAEGAEEVAIVLRALDFDMVRRLHSLDDPTRLSEREGVYRTAAIREIIKKEARDQGLDYDSDFVTVEVDL